jgi:gamma-butyrobetaine dioxygenase
MPDIRIAAAASAPQLMLRDAQGERPLPALWLRARSPDPLERDEVTGQRLTNPHQLPDDLTLTDARAEGGRLRLSFSDGHTSVFDPQDLINGAVLDEGCPAPRVWRADLSPLPVHQWPDLGRDDALFAATRDLIELGFVLIHATPTDPKAILDIARRFGFVRETNFGSFFEVYSRPNSTDLAYRPVALGPHTDNPYRTPVPGLQLLHCLQNETSGGLSTLVDSLAVAQQLQHEDPEGFALLSRTPVRFEYRDATTQLVAVKPMIELDGAGQMIGVHYSPRLDDIPLMSDADTRRYHRARKRFGQLFEDPAVRAALPARPGPADDVRQQPRAAWPHIFRSVGGAPPAARLLH